MMKGVRRGCVRLKGAVIGIDDQDVNTFTITVDHKTFHFQARDADEREKWVRRLEDTILRYANRSRALWEQQYSGGSAGSTSYGTPGSSTRRTNNLALFDKKVTEADAYLQLMIEQTTVIEDGFLVGCPVLISFVYYLQKIDNRIQALEEGEEALCLKGIHDHANNTANPINGVYQGQLMNKSETETEASDTVPETSYSSSEGEDDFFDANDDPFTSSQLNTPTSNTRTLSDPTARLSADEQFATAEDGTSTSVSLKKQDSLDTSTASAATPNASTAGGPRKSYDSKSLPIRNDGSLDYDALYEDESDNDLSMESHGSVVTHLLSQVKIGMDLTKVVLPTFILERRSLLEMYADYFAHPDLFLRIADLNDPRERMVQVVRWYLSAYHAGRKSSVAKKPYNPILGEIFQCHWDTPDMPTGDDNSNIEIYSPNDKKSFLSITGEWSGLMEYKFNDGSKSSKLETFVDVNSIPIFKKQVRPVCEQSECESRKVWKEVTAGLKMNDIDKATNAKFLVEQKQREEARERKETSGEWANKQLVIRGYTTIHCSID
ncbi:hypothetical protein quinque_002499 [Culex quinquefasciatus]